MFNLLQINKHTLHYASKSLVSLQDKASSLTITTHTCVDGEYINVLEMKAAHPFFLVLPKAYFPC